MCLAYELENNRLILLFWLSGQMEMMTQVGIGGQPIVVRLGGLSGMAADLDLMEGLLDGTKEFM